MAGRPVGSKNSPKSPVFVFKSAEDRNYFIRTEIPSDLEYSVYTQSSTLKPGVFWFYLKLVFPKTKEV